MRRFRFRLERVLELKRSIEEKIEIEFQFKMAEYLKIKRKIDELKEELGGFIKTVRLEAKTFGVGEIQAIDNYIYRLEIMIKSFQVKLDEKGAEVEEVRKRLQKAKKERRALEILKERRYQEYLEEVKREEFIELDDITQKLYLNKEKLTLENVPLEEM